jgi:hypothetical protein
MCLQIPVVIGWCVPVLLRPVDPDISWYWIPVNRTFRLMRPPLIFFRLLTLFLNLCNLLNDEEHFFVIVVVDGKGFLELAKSDIEPTNGNNMPSARQAVTAIHALYIS